MCKCRVEKIRSCKHCSYMALAGQLDSSIRHPRLHMHERACCLHCNGQGQRLCPAYYASCGTSGLSNTSHRPTPLWPCVPLASPLSMHDTSPPHSPHQWHPASPPHDGTPFSPADAYMHACMHACTSMPLQCQCHHWMATCSIIRPLFPSTPAPQPITTTARSSSPPAASSPLRPVAVHPS